MKGGSLNRGHSQLPPSRHEREGETEAQDAYELGTECGLVLEVERHGLHYARDVRCPNKTYRGQDVRCSHWGAPTEHHEDAVLGKHEMMKRASTL